MRKRFCLLPALALALLCACSKGAAKTPPTRPADFTSTERQFNSPADGDTIAIFDTSLGEVRAVLYPDAAPMAVYNFVCLARSGYYDNTTIWRSEYGFAVQGGDATGTGTGGSTIWSNNPYPPEASADLKHYAGALCAAFAAGGDVTGGNSQFYFVTPTATPTRRSRPTPPWAGCRILTTPTQCSGRSIRAWTLWTPWPAWTR